MRSVAQIAFACIIAVCEARRVSTEDTGVRTAYADEPTCKNYCVHHCHELNGNDDLECGLCRPEDGYRCFPGADGYEATSINLAEAVQRRMEADSDGVFNRVGVRRRVPNGATATAIPDRLHDVEARMLESGDPVLLSRYGGRVLLVANLASHCRHADRSYARLNELHARYASRGLSVLGFPSGTFFQEFEAPEEILRFATAKQGAKFDLFRTVKVNGKQQHPLFAFLKHHAGGGDIASNYETFAVDRSGAVVKRWETDADLVGDEATALLEGLLDATVADAAAEAAVQAVVGGANGGGDAEEGAGVSSDTCQYVTSKGVNALDDAARALLFSKPTVISGLIDGSGGDVRWRAFDELGSPANFSARFGHFDILARRTTAGVVHMQTVDAARERFATTTVSLADLVAFRAHEQIVIYDGEEGRSDLDDVLLDEASEFSTVPDVLARAAAVRVFSFGGGLGVRMANHGFAWLGLVFGEKRWYLAPPVAARPGEPTCAWDRCWDRGEDLGADVTMCVQRPGDVIVVPTAWWHATCNCAAYTFSMGGQDACDLHGVPPHWTADPAKQRQCHGPLGREYAERAWPTYLASEQAETRVKVIGGPPSVALQGEGGGKATPRPPKPVPG